MKQPRLKSQLLTRSLLHTFKAKQVKHQDILAFFSLIV